MATPLDDSEIKTVLVVTAHPDDLDFGAGGTLAAWIEKGIEVHYLICTNGDQGGEWINVLPENMPAIRQKEQRDAAAVIGTKSVEFLNYVDGHLAPTHELREKIVRHIRKIKPDRMVIQSPERNWERIGASHPDHLAAGEAAIQAVYPDSRNPMAFLHHKEEGLEHHRVREVWVMGHPKPEHINDITSTMDKKLAALHCHVSQVGHNAELDTLIKEWGRRNAQTAGLPEGHYAEAFLIVNTD
jgi:LmbE family N-acetylglucosaminyl deacetylase